MWTDGTHISKRAMNLELCKKGLGADNTRFQQSISGHTLWANICNATIKRPIWCR